jgi:hypothetical protein
MLLLDPCRAFVQPTRTGVPARDGRLREAA